MSYTVKFNRIPWYQHRTDRPLPLGRIVVHDSRNRMYRHQRTSPVLVTRLHTRHIPILDQGRYGSCTGNAQVGVMGTSPEYETMPAGLVMDEALALKIYSAAEVIDGNGPFPPSDYGSSGPSAAKAAMKLGLISGYTHCLSLTDVLDALQYNTVSIGINWYESMDSPPSSGLLTVSGGVRGGHEVVLRGIDVEAKTVYGDNSWGTSWGVDGGSFRMSWVTLDRLLHEDGDGTVSVPLNKPAPVPTPVPAADADADLWTALKPWAMARHITSRPGVPSNRAAATTVKAWAKLKGFS